MTNALVCAHLKTYLQSIQRRRVMVIARLEVLFLHNLNAFLGFDAFENDRLVYAPCNGNIAIILKAWIEIVRVYSLPKSLIVKRVEPVLQFLLVFKFLHKFSLPHMGFCQKENLNNRFTLDKLPLVVVADRTVSP